MSGHGVQSGTSPSVGEIIDAGHGVLTAASSRGLCIFDQSFHVLWGNERMAELTGVPISESLGRTLEEVLPDRWPEIADLYRAAAKGERIRITTTPGPGANGERPRAWSYTIDPIVIDGVQVGLAVLTEDVTVAHQVEAALVERSRLYAMFTLVVRAVVEAKTVEEMFQQACEVIVGIGEFRAAVVSERRAGEIRAVASAGDLPGKSELINMHPDASDSPGPSRAFPFGDDHSEYVLGVFTDEGQSLTADVVEAFHQIVASFGFGVSAVARRLELEQERAELRVRDEAIFGVQQGISISEVAPDGLRVTYVNPGMEKLIGVPAAELLGKPPPFLTSPDIAPALRESIAAAIREGRTTSGKVTRHRPDGSVVIADGYLAPVRDASGTVTRWVTSLADVTERELLEERLHRAERVQDIGRLAAGIAHDFNNLLTVMSASSDLALRRLDDDHAAVRQIRAIQDAVVAAGRMTRQLLLFSREQAANPEVVDLGDLVLESEPFLRRLIGGRIAFTTDVARNGDCALIDRGQFGQVLVNLSVNALQAMAEGGVLTIATRVETIAEGLPPGVAVGLPGSYVVLSVADTGVGMSDEVRERAFDPFFTTKGPGEGSGLGLSVVDGIVKNANGFVVVDSAPGSGSRFDIYLPRVAADGGGGRDSYVIDELPRGDEAVLLVEEDEALRHKLVEVLGLCGYRVTEATSGDAAVSLMETGEGAFDIVVSAAIVSGLAGAALEARVQELRPGMPLLFMSGYSDDVLGRRGVDREQVRVLSKPFSPGDLARAVREVLDGTSTATTQAGQEPGAVPEKR